MMKLTKQVWLETGRCVHFSIRTFLKCFLHPLAHTLDNLFFFPTQITYAFGGGVQSGAHPLPGQPYYAVGFPRVAFLPDTEKGRRALKMLERAFERR